MVSSILDLIVFHLNYMDRCYILGIPYTLLHHVAGTYTDNSGRSFLCVHGSKLAFPLISLLNASLVESRIPNSQSSLKTVQYVNSLMLAYF